MSSPSAPPHPAQIHLLVPLDPEVRVLLPRGGAELHEVGADRLIAAFTASQSGVVGRRQLLAAGVSARAIGGRLERRVLVPRFRGVYAASNLHLTTHGHRTAAVLAVPGSLAGGRSATALHGISPPESRWHVTVPSNGGRRHRHGIDVTTSTTLTASDMQSRGGLPCTSVARSIVDAASHSTRSQVANLLACAERAGILHVAAIREVLERVQRRPSRGLSTLVEALDEHVRIGAQLSRSEVEAALRDIAVRAGLPAPQLNRVVFGEEVDALWPDAGIGIEIDSWQFHRDRRAFVADRAKLRRLYLRGFVVLPYAAADITCRPQLVAAELAAARSRSAALLPT